MIYKFNKNTNEELELEIFTDIYLPYLNENDVITIFVNSMGKCFRKTIKKDSKGLFLKWNKKKYYIKDYYKYTKEDIIYLINNKSLTPDIFIQGIMNYGVDKIIIKVPEKMYDYNCGSMEKLIDSTIKPYHSFKIIDNYKINTVTKDNRKNDWYVCDLVDFLDEGICKIEFK